MKKAPGRIWAKKAALAIPRVPGFKGTCIETISDAASVSSSEVNSAGFSFSARGGSQSSTLKPSSRAIRSMRCPTFPTPMMPKVAPVSGMLLRAAAPYRAEKT